MRIPEPLFQILSYLYVAVMVVVVGAILVFALDATIGRLFGSRRVLRHRGSGPWIVAGEMGVLLCLGTAVAMNTYRPSETPGWLIALLIIGVVLGFIGQGAGQKTGA